MKSNALYNETKLFLLQQAVARAKRLPERQKPFMATARQTTALPAAMKGYHVSFFTHIKNTAVFYFKLCLLLDDLKL